MKPVRKPKHPVKVVVRVAGRRATTSMLESAEDYADRIAEQALVMRKADERRKMYGNVQIQRAFDKAARRAGK